jgi:hypothetical protein
VHSPALIVAWQLWRRHQYGMVLVVAWLAGVCCLYQALPAGSLRVYTPALAIIPWLVAFLYAVAVFCYGFDNMDLATRDSCFPARLFTLPVRTGELIRWPMLYGTAAVAVIWLVLALGVFRRSDLDVPLWWPALLFAGLLAWFQALLWMPFGLPWLRVVVIVGLLIPLLVVGLILGEKLDVPEAVAVPVLACLLGAAYVVAHIGLAHARRGDVPDWRRLFRFTAGGLEWLPVRRESFSSARRAALWLEWRQAGYGLPLLGIMALFILTSLVAVLLRELEQAGMEDKVFPNLPGLSARANTTLVTLGYFLLLPPLLTVAGSWAVIRLPAYQATLPLGDAALVAVKLRMAAVATVLLWAPVLPVAALWLWVSGRYDSLLEVWRSWLPGYSPPEVAALVLAILLGLVILTWSELAKGLFFALTGRRWVTTVSAGRSAGILMLASLLTGWLAVHAEYRPAAWEIARVLLPWLAGLALVLKLSAATWVVRELRRRELLTSRALVWLPAAWAVTAAGLFGLFAWVLPAGVVPWPWLAVIVLLVLPLARLVGTPLALAWNRHR